MSHLIKFLVVKILGALTSKPFAFTTRSWELESRKFFDFLDPFATKISLYFRKNQITRVTSLAKHFFKDLWLTDKIRFAINVLNFNRILSISLLWEKKNTYCLYLPAASSLLVGFIVDQITHVLRIASRVDFIAGSTLDLVQARHVQKLALTFGGCGRVQLMMKDFIGSSCSLMRRHFISERQMLIAEAIVCVGLNLRKISPTYFNFIQKNMQQKSIKFLGSMLVNLDSGFFLSSAYNPKFISNRFFELVKLGKGSHLFLCEVLLSFSSNFFLFSHGFQSIAAFFEHTCRFIAAQVSVVPASIGYTVFAELELAAGTSTFDRNYIKYKNFLSSFTNMPKKKFNVLYLLEVENIGFDHSFYDFVVYRGAYWDVLAYAADMVLPYLNLLEFPKVSVFSANGAFSMYRQPIILQSTLPNFSLFNLDSQPSVYEVEETIYDLICEELTEDFYFFETKDTADRNIDKDAKKKISNFYNEIPSEDFFFNTALTRINPVFSLKTKQLLVSTNNFKV